MKKFLAIILTVLMVAATFTACSANVDGLMTGANSDLVNNPAGNPIYPNGVVNPNASVGGSESASESGSGSGSDEASSGEGSSEIVDNTTYTRNGSEVEFGSYPQASVTAAEVIEILNGKAGTPGGENWTSYGYSNSMWYIDVQDSGKKYRGVYFTDYRPNNASNSSEDPYYQDNNGYDSNKVYWFEYQPIKWTVINEGTGKVLLLCNISIDSQPYGAYSNAYAQSTIRVWLNDTFYKTAFNVLQQELIETTNLDNSVASTGHGENTYASSNTDDKIFLLSRAEVKDYAYGVTAESTRQRGASDYALAQGKYVDSNSVGWWWLRSPNPTDYSLAYRIKTDGTIHSTDVSATSGGIVPALWLKLAEEDAA